MLADSVHDRREDNATAYCERALRRLRDEGRGCVVFDIDNTLVDTRPRTVSAARAFAGDELEAGHAMARASIDDVDYCGVSTGKRFGLRGDALRRFAMFWEATFWDPMSFAHDTPLPATVRWARAAQAQGTAVVYLTGRIEALREPTLAQIDRLGLPLVDVEHLVCKPQLGIRTGQFKARALGEIRRSHGAIGWFMTESHADIAAAQEAGFACCVLVDFPVNPERPPRIASDTLRLALQ